MRTVPRDEVVALAEAINSIKELKRNASILFYKPYPKQREFHEAGVDYSERCIGAGNQLGKTLAGGNEAAYHATGLYPADWNGIRFEKPIVGWACGVTGETVRDSVQKILVGRVQDVDGIGTGSIPKSKLILPLVKSSGVRDLLDHIAVKHVTGGQSLIFLKSYASGREKFQAETIDWIWFDEEPEEEIYSEGLTRTNNGQNGQCAWLTYTPIQGMTKVSYKFYSDPHDNQHLTIMTIDDVDHYTDEEKAAIIQSYPDHERDARVKGIPSLGSGRVFPVADRVISIDPIPIPDWWPRIKGLDFGWDHPNGLACCAWDRENDVWYVYDAHREREELVSTFASAINHRKDWIPVAWPHDALKHDPRSGIRMAQLYADEGVNMLEERATFEDGTNSVEPGNFEMLDRMRTGRFKVFNTLPEWFEEFRLYHRKDGKLVKLRDDLLSATRYALMMKRFAEVWQDEWHEEDTRPMATGVMGYN